MVAAAGHLPPPHVGVIERACNLAEFQPEKPGRTVEHRPQHGVQRQVGLQHRLIQIMLGAATLLAVIAPVPGLQRPRMPVRFQHRLQHRRIRQRLAPRRLPDPHQKVAHRSRSLRHLRLQLEGGKVGIAEELRPFMPQSQDFRRNRPVVRLAPIGAARDPGLIGLLAQCTVRGKLQDRHDQRPVQRHHRPGALFRPRRLGRVLDEARQGCEIGLRQFHEPRPFIGQQVLAERRPQHRQPRLHRCQPLRRQPLQRRAGPHEHLPVQLQHPPLLGRQTQGFAPLPQSVDLRPKRLVVGDLAGESAHFRRQIPHHCLARLGAVGTRQIVEDPRHPVEIALRKFQRLDHLGKFRPRTLRNCRDVRPCPRESLVKGRTEVLVPDRRKRRQSERSFPLFQKHVHRKSPLLRS